MNTRKHEIPADIYLSTTPYANIWLVYKGLKPAYRLDFPAPDLRFLERTARDLGLIVLKPLESPGFRKSLPMTNDDSFYRYIARDRAQAERLRRTDQMFLNNKTRSHEQVAALNKLIGELLGYPACCIAFFVAHSRLSNPELIFLAAGNTNARARAECNTLSGNYVVTHNPCSLDCARTLRQVRRYSREKGIGEAVKRFSGTYIYFVRGQYVKLRITERQPLWQLFEIVEVSQGAYRGLLEDPEIAPIIKSLRQSDRLRLEGDRLILAGHTGKAVGFSGRMKTWIFVEFE